MLLKDKKIRVWCHKEPVTDYFYIGKRKGNSILGSTKKIKLPSKIKCPDCGKRFAPRIRASSDSNCWHVYLPAHKKEIKIKKSKK